MISTAKALVDEGVKLGGDLLITAVADEEYASIGTEDLVKRVTADAAIVTEPTDLTISCAHRGFIWYDVQTFGKAAHGSRFQDGIDANMHMGQFLSRLKVLERDLRHRKPHPLAGPPSLHAARIHGGTEMSIYAAQCLLQIERRTIPGETETQATAEIQSILNTLSEDDSTFKAEVKSTFVREPFEINLNASIVKNLENVVADHIDHVPTFTGQSFWTDAAILSAAGIETVLVGPKGHGLHSEEEWVDIQSVVDLAHILADTACSYCN